MALQIMHLNPRMPCYTVCRIGSVPLDVICVFLFHLCCYYEREVLRGIYQRGSLDVAAEYSIYKRDPTLIIQQNFKNEKKVGIEKKQRNKMGCLCNSDSLIILIL